MNVPRSKVVLCYSMMNKICRSSWRYYIWSEICTENNNQIWITHMVCPVISQADNEGRQLYSSTQPQHLYRCGWSMQCPSHFNPEKEMWYPWYTRLYGSGKSHLLPEFESWTVQRIASHYTNYVSLAAHIHNLAIVKFNWQLLSLIAPLTSEIKVNNTKRYLQNDSQYPKN